MVVNVKRHMASVLLEWMMICINYQEVIMIGLKQRRDNFNFRNLLREWKKKTRSSLYSTTKPNLTKRAKNMTKAYGNGPNWSTQALKPTNNK